MVSLTSLLVLATFFSQGSLTIPKTAYLKLIDVWYVALITQVFLVVMSLVLVEYFRLRDMKRSKNPITVVAPISDIMDNKPVGQDTNPSSLPARLSTSGRVNKVLIIVFPAGFAIFIFVFVGACVAGLKS
ncbi:hypothetical protein Pmani_031535 [Petrolisthes manimaculis]|uniref:Uncharacterized protein n=1 Tax=Petrolisthes manimaculis TaxID=1843537 RepID=A0AAE1TRW0_9EUCA|nr:hypothetical protein Pmani_031535 [Petrolisthes manimaculis]